MSNVRDASSVVCGSFANYRFVPTRSVVQLIIECPVEMQEHLFRILGFPMPGTELPVAVVRLTNPPQLADRPAETSSASPQRSQVGGALPPKPAHTKTTGEQARIRAVMLCKDQNFQRWICPGVASEEEATARFRFRIGGSRSGIATNTTAYYRFLELEEEYRRETGASDAS